MKEKTLAFLGSGTVLPERYYDALRRTEYLEPEKTLLLAILEDDQFGIGLGKSGSRGRRLVNARRR